ncbi:MAG: glycoside hydrolase 100 family protein [Terracidiphilus sp.]|nr:glycoside hydrolase 100 family protein [Terracidiphilus sp.]
MSLSEKELVHIEQAKEAALHILLRNAQGPFQGLPRTAGSGYPEPYTRDLMISSLGFLATGSQKLADALERTLVALANNQTEHGHIASLANDRDNRGSSDSTPLFLFGLALYRRASNQPEFLKEEAEKALRWMQYQSPDDRVMVSQLPTSDWRDEQYVMGYGLYVNTIVYAYLRLYGEHESARQLQGLITRLELSEGQSKGYEQEALVEPAAAYYALYSYKGMSSDRFDLLGNSLAILTGIASPQWAGDLLTWVESECEAMQERGELAVHLPPCLLPYILPHHDDWLPRYERYNRPGDYHNGGVWPFICGFYVAACVAAGKMDLAERKLLALTNLVKPGHDSAAEWGFNEWIHAQTGQPCGCNWQTWSAAMYLYAAECVQTGSTPYFDEIRDYGVSGK